MVGCLLESVSSMFRTCYTMVFSFTKACVVGTTSARIENCYQVNIQAMKY